MSKILGIDLGSSSIGWAYIEPYSNNVFENGIRVCSLHHERQKKRASRRIAARSKYRIGINKLYFPTTKCSPIIIGLILISGFTFLLSLVNYRNWQFWLNLAITSVLTTLTLIHQDKENK